MENIYNKIKEKNKMDYIVNENLRDFEFWSGARDRVKYLTDEELDSLEPFVEEMFGEELPTDTAINDLFWFDKDIIAQYLGYDSFEEIIMRESKNENYIREEQDGDYKKEISKIDRIISKLKSQVKRNGYKENMGYKEFRNYMDTISFDCSYRFKLSDYFQKRLEEL